MKRLLFLVALSVVGCAVRGTSLDVEGIRTFDGLSDRYPASASRLATQAAQALSERYTASQTSLALVRVPGLFGDKLEHALRGKGFAIVSPEYEGLRVGYVLDEIKGESAPQGYVQLRASDGMLLSLAQSLHTDAVVESPVELVPSPAYPLAPEPVAPIASPVKESLPTGDQRMLLPNAVLAELPYDWKYTIPDASRRSRRVSWPNNIPWRDAIINMALEADCNAVFDETNKRVTLHTRSVSPVLPPVAAPAPAPKATASSHAQPSPPEVRKALQEVAATPVAVSPDIPEPAPSMPEPILPPAETWTLESGSLYHQLGLWTEQAGYQLVWKAQDDLIMQAASSFSGAFEDVVRQLFTGLARSGHNLRATLYSNKVMEVRGE